MKNKMNMPVLFTLLFIFVSAISSSVQAQAKTEILIIADQKMNCAVANGCLQIKRIYEEKFNSIQQNIEKFNYAPGYFYVLEVEAANAKNTQAQAAKNKYRLKKILARVKSEETPPQNQPDFFGTEWKLTKIDGQNVNAAKAFIRFDETKNSAGGNGGCNVFGGSLEKKGSQIKISEVFSTKRYCEETSEIENKFLGNLDRVTKYRIADGKLILSAGERDVLEFVKRN